MDADAHDEAAVEAAWPDAGGRDVVLLLEAETAEERRLLRSWARTHRPADAAECTEVVIHPVEKEAGAPVDAALERRLAAGDDPLLQPLRVVWLPPERGGVRAARLRDLLRFHNPRQPDRVSQVWLSRMAERHRVVAAEPAPVSELKWRWKRSVGDDDSQISGFASFVARQATLALERAERHVIGNRYKVPALVREEITSRASWRSGVADLALKLDKGPQDLAEEAAADLRELAAGNSAYTIDLAADFSRLVYSQAYESRLRYDRQKLSAIGEKMSRYPVVFLPSHKTYLDHLVLRWAMHEVGLPPNHVAGGANLNIFPINALYRRAGMFFLRRSFKDDDVYKFVLAQYLDFLVEKRFSLEWYIEGGRSRSGKLLPPRYGLLSYVVDSYSRNKAPDVLLVPVSIVYDQLQDVGTYVAEQHGAKKRPETFGFFLKYIEALRQPWGEVSMDFGEPVSVREMLGAPDEAPPHDSEARHLAVQKMAFEVCTRINEVTPITPTALVTFALLGVGDRWLSVEQIITRLQAVLDYVSGRDLPTSRSLDLGTPSGVCTVLDELIRHDVVTCFAEGPEPVYQIGPDQHLAAAYYRNTIIHFFVNLSICELAGLKAAEIEPGPESDPVATFWDEAFGLRDLLKFEFFFAGKDRFRQELCAELSGQDPEWEARLAKGGREARDLVRSFRPYSSQRTLRPFLEAYQIVAEALTRESPASPLDAAAFLDRCMASGKQYHLQHRIRSAESVSRVLYETALKLASNRGLVEPGSTDLRERREELAVQIRDVLSRIETMSALQAARMAGLDY